MDIVASATLKYDEKGLLVGWGMNNRVIYSRVDNQCIAGWFGIAALAALKMMCENDNLVVGEILRSVEEYKERHSKAKHNTANAEEIEGDSIAKDIKINYKENKK